MSKLKKEAKQVHEDTDFKSSVVGITRPGEFKYTHGGSVRLGLEYHIHYTDTKQEVFMTGGGHSTSSKIIEKIDGSKSLFSTYTKIKNVVKNEYPKKYNPIPSEGDYGGGSLDRYFTQKANNLNGELFEISKEDFDNKNTLFRYVKISWRLTGKKSEVIRDNTRTINTFSTTRGNEELRKILSPSQLWKAPKGSIDDVTSKLSRRKII
jgi:hypothetical protein